MYNQIRVNPVFKLLHYVLKHIHIEVEDLNVTPGEDIQNEFIGVVSILSCYTI